MKILAIIPARGGSKGIPNKNTVCVGRMPLIARTISAIKRCTLIDTVLVTTDDGKIAAIAREYGAEVVDRPKELAGDEVSSESVVLHACSGNARRKQRE